MTSLEKVHIGMVLEAKALTRLLRDQIEMGEGVQPRQSREADQPGLEGRFPCGKCCQWPPENTMQDCPMDVVAQGHQVLPPRNAKNPGVAEGRGDGPRGGLLFVCSLLCGRSDSKTQRK